MSKEVDKVVVELVKIVREVKPGAALNDSIDPGVHVMEDLGFDSLDFINLLFQVEETYGFKIPEPDIDEHELFKFGALASYIAARC
jgi:acyl carrier protein